MNFWPNFSWNLRQKQILLITSLQPSNPFISHTGNGFFIVLLERKMKTPWSNLEKFHFRRNILCMIFISSLTLMTFLKGIVWTCCHEVYLFPSWFSHVYTKMKSHCGKRFSKVILNPIGFFIWKGWNSSKWLIFKSTVQF